MAAIPLTAQAVADLVGGRLSGNGEWLLGGVSALDGASPSDLSFLASSRYLSQFLASQAGCVLVPPALAEATGGPTRRIIVDDPQRALQQVLELLHPAPVAKPGVHPTAILGAGVRLGTGICLGPHVVVGDGCQLGDRVRLGPGVVLEEGVIIGADSDLGPRVTCGHGVVLGSRVRVKAGAVIGGSGFGYISGALGHQRIPHVGGCRVGDDVDVGANACIDRGSVGETVIGRGTKIDNLVHIAHNVRIGEHCLLMAGVGIAGSTRIGNRVVLAGQAGVSGHLVVGDDARIGAQSGVIRSVAAGAEVSGFPARPHREFMRAQGALYRLAPVARRLEALGRADPNDA